MKKFSKSILAIAALAAFAGGAYAHVSLDEAPVAPTSFTGTAENLRAWKPTVEWLIANRCVKIVTRNGDVFNKTSTRLTEPGMKRAYVSVSGWLQWSFVSHGVWDSVTFSPAALAANSGAYKYGVTHFCGLKDWTASPVSASVEFTEINL